MAKESDILQAVRDRDLPALTKLLSKHNRHKAKPGSSTKKLNVNFQDSDGMSALHQASLQGDENCMALLLDSGALTNVRDVKGMSPLHYACWQGQLEPVRMLLDCGAVVDSAADDGETPLHLACQHGHLEVVCLLLHHGANPAAQSKSKKTPLDLACEFGKLKVVEHLIQSRLCNHVIRGHQTLDFTDSSETTCLHLASKNGHASVVQLLLSSGVDVNWQTAQGTALHEAALFGKTNVVRLLIQHGVDINISNSFDQTALDVVDKFTARAGAKELKMLLHEASNSVLARAVKDYGSAYDKSILTLKAGDLVTILERRSDGFWKGFLTEAGSSGAPGFFPADCVVILGAGSQRSAGATEGRSGSGPLFSGSLGVRHGNDDHRYEAPFSPTAVDASGDSTVYSPLWGSSSANAKPLFSADPNLQSPCLYQAGQVPGSAFPQLTCNNSSYPAAAVGQRSNSTGGGARESRGSSARNYGNVGSSAVASARPPSLQSGQSVDGNESIASGGGLLSRRSVRSDDGCSAPADACSSISGGSAERLAGVERRVGSRAASEHDECSSAGGGEDDWESGYASCSFNPSQMLQQGTRDSEVLRAWLCDMHFGGYTECFLQAGYDMATVSRMTPEDLTAIGITTPAHRRKLTTEIARLNIYDGLPDYKPASVMEWLQLLGLEQYHDALVADGYSSVSSLTDITWEDLEDIGIKKLGHQKKVMLAIEQLKKVGKRHSRGSQSSCGSSDVQATAIAMGAATVASSKQPMGCRPMDAPRCSRNRAHHRSVSGEMAHTLDSGYGAGPRAATRQLSCDSAMTRSLMLQQTYPPSTGTAHAVVSRSSSGNLMNACIATGEYASPRSLPFCRGEQGGEDSISINSSEDSASSAGSSGGHHSGTTQPRKLLRSSEANARLVNCDRVADRHRHVSGGSSSITGASPPQYSTLLRNARSCRVPFNDDSSYSDTVQSLREVTPPSPGAVMTSDPQLSPFSNFKSPYQYIHTGLVRNAIGPVHTGSSTTQPLSDALPHQLQKMRIIAASHPHNRVLESENEQYDEGTEEEAAELTPEAIDADSASSSSECDLDGQEFPPAAPPIAFDMQHMRVHKQTRAIGLLPESRVTTAAAATTGTAGRTAADSEAGIGANDSGTPTTQRRAPMGRTAARLEAGPQDACASTTLPFANENAGTIRQRAPSSGSSCSGGEASSKQPVSDSCDWEGTGNNVAPGYQRRAARALLDATASCEGLAEDRRLARPVMHVQPVMMCEQRHTLSTLPALSALQRHIFGGSEDIKLSEKDTAACLSLSSSTTDSFCATELDAILEHDADAT